jgi:hypothetical protein
MKTGLSLLIILFVLSVGITTAAAQCEDRTIHIGPISAWKLDHIGGDCEMEGHNPAIRIDLSVRREGSRLVVTGSLNMKEDRRDFTEFKKEIREEVFVPELEVPECEYREIDLDWGRLRKNGGRDNHVATRYKGEGLIEYATCLSDTKGNDCGVLGCDIDLHPITVRLAPK